MFFKILKIFTKINSTVFSIFFATVAFKNEFKIKRFLEI